MKQVQKRNESGKYKEEFGEVKKVK